MSAGGLFLSSNVLKIYWNACRYVLSKQLKLWNVSHILPVFNFDPPTHWSSIPGRKRVGLIRISGSSKNPRLYVANTLLYSSHDNISDCSIREYRSIVATITGHQAIVPPYILINRLFQPC